MALELRVISLGAGVQSTAMALMASRGEIEPMPDAAIFADVGDEPAAVYHHLEWLMSGVLSFPVYITRKGNMTLSEAVVAGDKEARPPLFMKTKKGHRGMLGRQCTRNFKLYPIRRKTRELLGKGIRSYIAPGTVEAWIGISTDEVIRAVPSGLKYLINRHPLIEKGLSRVDCLSWLKERGYPRPPKSSCVYCPYRSNAQWRDMRDTAPEDFAAAVRFDRAVRSPKLQKLYGAKTFVHRSLVPLDKADLGSPDEEMYDHDCEGNCGV